MFSRRCLLITRCFRLLCQSPNNNNNALRRLRISHSLQRLISCGPNEPIVPTEKNDSVLSKDEENDRKMKYLQLEITYLHDRGRKVPDINSIGKHQWDELMKTESKSARMKYYYYLYITAKKKGDKKVSLTFKIPVFIMLTYIPNIIEQSRREDASLYSI